MSLSIGELVGYVDLDTTGVKRGAAQTRRTMGGLADDMDGTAKRGSSGFGKLAGTALKGLAIGMGTAGVAGGVMGVKTAAGMEQAKIAFETMLGSADKADSFLRDLSDFAAATPFEFPELQTAASSLIASGVEAGKVIPIMTTLGDVTAGMGTGSEGIQRATVALQQMQAAGKITGEDLNQLRDAGIPVFDLLAAATGKSKQEVVALAQAGKLGGKELGQLMKALETGKGLERFNGLMEKQSKSLSGMWSSFADTLNMKLAAAVEPLIPMLKDGLAGATQVLADVLPKVTAGLLTLVGAIKSTVQWTREHATVVQIIGGAILAFLLPAYILAGIEAVKSAAKQVWSWATTQAAAVKTVAQFVIAKTVMVAGWAMMGARAMAGALKVAASWLIALGPIGLVIALVAGVVVAIVKNWDTIKAATAKAWGWITGAVTRAWDAIKGGVTKGVTAVVGFVKRNWPVILAVLTGPIGLAVLAIARNWDKIKAGASGVVNWIKGIPGKIGALGGRFAQAGRNLLQGFINGMKNAAGVISGIAGNVWDTVRGLLNGAIGKINAALEFKINLPGPDVTINPPNIPMLATGGRATGATLAVFGEGREAETVLPDSMLRGLLERVHEAGRQSARRDESGRTAPLIGQLVQQPGEDGNVLAERLWFLNKTRG